MMRASDWWVRAAFSSSFMAQAWFRQSGVISSRPPRVTHTIGHWRKQRFRLVKQKMVYENVDLR